MATEQTNIIVAIVQAAAEAARAMVQTMAAVRAVNSTRHKGTQSMGPK